MDISQATAYTGMGQSQFKKWAAEIGSTRRFGRSVRYDRRVIDKALDDMCTGDGGMTVDSVTA